MMITNDTGLPNHVYEAIKGTMGEYNSGDSDITISSLIAPPRLVELKRQHATQLYVDAADLANSLIGTAVHSQFEKYASSEHSEDRKAVMVLGWKVSGKPDDVEIVGNVLTDFKTAKVNQWKYGGKDEWEQQLNCYAEILRVHGVQIDRIQVVVVFKDWSPDRWAFNKEWYPDRSIMVIDVPLWDRVTTQAFIYERVMRHQQAREELPLCTDEEKWQRSTGWAVRKKGNTKATKVFRTEDYESEEAAYAAAEEFANGDEKYEIEQRVGEPLRCRFYCEVSEHCAQWLGEAE